MTIRKSTKLHQLYCSSICVKNQMLWLRQFFAFCHFTHLFIFISYGHSLIFDWAWPKVTKSQGFLKITWLAKAIFLSRDRATQPAMPLLCSLVTYTSPTHKKITKPAYVIFKRPVATDKLSDRKSLLFILAIIKLF